MMKSNKQTQKSLRTVEEDDGKIRVTAGKKKRFSLFKKLEPTEEQVLENVIYEPESLKGRNPSEVKSKTSTIVRISDLKGRNPKDFGPCDPYGNPIKSTRRGSLEGRNPVDFDKAKDYATDPYGNPNPTPKDSLSGRSPQDFCATDPYGNPIHTRDDPLAGRNPTDFVVPTDPYGNPIKSRGGNISLEGRNPKDFDGPTDPYRNPIKTNKISSRSNPLKGRNPKDFDGPKDLHDIPKNSNRGNPLEGRNPKDFNGPKDLNDLPNNSTRAANSLEGRNPKDFDGPKDLHDTPKRNSLLAGRDPKDFDSPKDLHDIPTKSKRNSLAGRNQKNFDQAANKGESSRRPDGVPSVIFVEEDENNKKPEARPRSSKTTKEKLKDSEKFELEHAETVKREIKKDVPEWADPNFQKNRRRRSSIKVAPKATREKFSLKTYHQPRVGVEVIN